MVKNLPAMERPGFDPWVRKISWRRKWQLTPVFSPGEVHEQRSLADYSPWSCRVRHDWVSSTFISTQGQVAIRWHTKIFWEAMVSPVVMYGCESWTIRKVERRRIDAFELWYWRRLLGVSWTARRSNLSILKETSPEYYWKNWCWSWSSNTLTTWWELTHWRRSWFWERLKVGGEGDDRRWDGWMASLTWWTWVWASSGSWWWRGKPGVL